MDESARIAGWGVTNPTVSIRSTKLMIGRLGEVAEAYHIENRVFKALEEGKILTLDNGENSNTTRAILFRNYIT